jgi:hypothetical protein
MTLFQKLADLENRINRFETSIPEWIPLTKKFANNYGYTLDEFRNYCFISIESNYIKIFCHEYYLNKKILDQIDRK